MRIITGTARGLRLQVPDGDTRPATDRTRQATFSMLGERVPDAHVLDLFCGSGAYGLEALSRGAASLHLVDRSPAAGRALRTNCSHPSFSPPPTIMICEVTSAIHRLSHSHGQTFDLIFADPPYADSVDLSSLDPILPLGELWGLLNFDGLLVLERSSASAAESAKPDAHSASSYAMRIPLPPPPADALSITG